MLLVEVITKAVDASWKVKSQTAKASCQGERRHGSATCCINQRTASGSGVQTWGQTLGVDTGELSCPPHRGAPTPYLPSHTLLIKWAVRYGFYHVQEDNLNRKYTWVLVYVV